MGLRLVVFIKCMLMNSMKISVVKPWLCGREVQGLNPGRDVCFTSAPFRRCVGIFASAMEFVHCVVIGAYLCTVTFVAYLHTGILVEYLHTVITAAYLRTVTLVA